MPMVYTHTYKVPTWIVLNLQGEDNEKRRTWLLKALEKAGARTQPWPGHTFGQALLGFRRKGYAHQLPVAYPYNLDTSLLLRACSEHIKTVLSPTSYLGGAFKAPAHRIDRKVESDADFEVLFNSVLALEDDIGLSQIFQVAEECYAGKANDSRVWVTVGPAPLSVLTRISNRVITIGDDPNNTICINEINTKKELEETLNNYFTKESQK